MMKLIHDIRNAARSLAGNPVYAGTAALCLALGVGANAAMFRVADTLLLSPPSHVEGADRLARVYVEKTYPGIGPVLSGSFSHPFVRQLSEGVESLEPAAYHRTEVSVGRGLDARRVEAVLTGAALFRVLGAEPALGRWPTRAESDPSEPPRVVVLGHGFWKRRFGGDPEILGRGVRIGESVLTVVGVAPAGFTGAELQSVELWLPFGFMGRLRDPGWYQNRGARQLELIARISPGETSERAASEATALLRHGEGEVGSSSSSPRVVLGPLLEERGPYESREVQVAWWLAGLSVFVLVIACANVANLQLARTLRRRREVAVRMSLGAGRGDVVRRHVAEGLTLASVGALAAGGVLVWGEEALRTQFVPGAPAPTPATILRVMGVAGGVALCAGLVTALPAAAQAWRRDLVAGIRSATGGVGAGHSRMQTLLLVAQISLGLVLLVGTGLFLESLREVRSIEVGMDMDRVLVAHVDLREEDPSPEELRALYWEMDRRVASLGGVSTTGLAAGIPLESTFGAAVSVPGRESMPSLPTGGPYVHPVSPTYFETLGIDLLRGRGFEEGVESTAGSPVVVVNETMAEQVWPDEDPLGRCLELGNGEAPCARVVGVSENTLRQRLGEGATMQLYVPLDHAPENMNTRGALLIRTRSRDARRMAAVARRELQTTRRDLPYVEVRPLSALLAPQIEPWRLGFRVLGLFGALALVLAALGTYSIMLYMVTQRVREIGVRMALGADRATVIRSLVGRGLKIAGLGIGLGLAFVLATGRFARPLLYEVEPWDPLTLTLAALVLTASVVAASFFPARRAARLDPVRTLRTE